jgi:hypothetical protein
MELGHLLTRSGLQTPLQRSAILDVAFVDHDSWLEDWDFARLDGNRRSQTTKPAIHHSLWTGRQKKEIGCSIRGKLDSIETRKNISYPPVIAEKSVPRQ